MQELFDKWDILVGGQRSAALSVGRQDLSVENDDNDVEGFLIHQNLDFGSTGPVDCHTRPVNTRTNAHEKSPGLDVNV